MTVRDMIEERVLKFRSERVQPPRYLILNESAYQELSAIALSHAYYSGDPNVSIELFKYNDLLITIIKEPVQGLYVDVAG